VALVSGVAHPSSSEGPLAAGSYSFQAHYNGEDPNYDPADSPCEPLTVNTTQTLGKTRGFWGNTNGHTILDPTHDGFIDSPVTIGGGTRSALVNTILKSDQILSGNVCSTYGLSPAIFTCTGTGTGQGLSDALKAGTLGTLAAQTLALTYNIQKITNYSGQTLGALSCSAVLSLTPSSTVNDALVLANSLIENSVFGGTTTQAQAGAMNTLLGDCLNREI
jgi:hypothetical protein